LGFELEVNRGRHVDGVVCVGVVRLWR
jgi:hypothetical protein